MTCTKSFSGSSPVLALLITGRPALDPQAEMDLGVDTRSDLAIGVDEDLAIAQATKWFGASATISIRVEGAHVEACGTQG